MPRLASAFTTLLLLPLPGVFARPNAHERLHERRHNHHSTDEHADFYTAPRSTGTCKGRPTFHPTGSGVPFPMGANSTALLTPTATGSSGIILSTNPAGNHAAPITVQSTLTIVPVPVSSPHANALSNSPSSCGPATVTVTTQNTVTVTVAPGETHSAAYSPPTEAVASTPAAQSPNPAAQPASAQQKSSTDIVAAIQPTKAGHETPAVNASPAPKSHKPAAAAASPAPAQPATHSSPKSSPKSSPSNSPKKDNTSPVAGKGLIYQDMNMAKRASGLGWASDWDSSPQPASGHATGSLDVQFVPQLICTQSVHTDVWAGNSQGHPWVMSINEPDQSTAVGGCGPTDVGSAVAFHRAQFAANKAAGQKVVSPCVSNPGDAWLDSFFSAIGEDMKPDAMCFHWYGESLDGLKSVVNTYKALQQKHGVSELWMSEFAFNVDVQNADQVVSYLESCGLDRWAYNALKLVTTPNLKAAYL